MATNQPTLQDIGLKTVAEDNLPKETDLSAHQFRKKTTQRRTMPAQKVTGSRNKTRSKLVQLVSTTHHTDLKYNEVL